MQRRSLKLKMQLKQLWKECFKNLGLPGFLTLSLWASSWPATRRPHEFLSERSKLFRRQSSQAASEEVVRGRLVLLEVSICFSRQKWARGLAWLAFGVLGCNTKTIKSLPAEPLYLVLPVLYVQPWPWNPEFLHFLLSSTLLRGVEVWSSLTK